VLRIDAKDVAVIYLENSYGNALKNELSKLSN